MRPRPLAALLLTLAVAILFAACGGGDSDDGTSATATTGGAPFEPHATLEAIGGTARTEKPELVMQVEARPGDANIRSVAVTLPPVVLVDSEALRICAKRELESDDCAGQRPLGSARVVSPAFAGALSGPVFVVSGSGKLPGLAYLLGGPTDILLRGSIASEGSRIQAGVDDVPDTPIEIFELTIDGGKPGFLVLSRDICRAEATADGLFTSQDGQTHREQIPLEAECG